jgi:hypothetical protein
MPGLLLTLRTRTGQIDIAADFFRKFCCAWQRPAWTTARMSVLRREQHVHRRPARTALLAAPDFNSDNAPQGALAAASASAMAAIWSRWAGVSGYSAFHLISWASVL